MGQGGSCFWRYGRLMPANIKYLLNMKLPAIDHARLQAAIEFAVAHETPWDRDNSANWGIHTADQPPWNRLLGPVHPRGGVSGVVRVGGRQIIEWGEPNRADLTFSVAKTYLALLAGVAHDRGLLPDLNEPVLARVPGIGFELEHNRPVTWLQLLQQTSEWQGECFGVPDQVDRYRHLQYQPPRESAGHKGDARPLQTPGSFWEYNDVRINQLSLALLHLFGQPLPELFEQAVLQPIGAGAHWQWLGYDDAWIDLPARDGVAAQRVKSVPGGSHWGAGISISARDQARIGQLLLDGGRHGAQQLVPAHWVARMSQPGPVAPFYGWLTWLNSEGRLFAQASHASWFMIGAGGHYVWLEPEQRAVVVVRWLDGAHAPGFVDRVAQALRSTGQPGRAVSP